MIKCKKMNISSIIPRLGLTLKFPVISQRSVYNWFVAKTPIYPTPDPLPLRNTLSEPSEMLCSGLKSSVLSTKYNITHPLPLRNTLSEPSEMLCSGLKSSVLSTKCNITLNFKLVHVLFNWQHLHQVWGQVARGLILPFLEGLNWNVLGYRPFFILDLAQRSGPGLWKDMGETETTRVHWGGREGWQVHIAPNTQQGAGPGMWPWKDYGYQLSGCDEEGSALTLGELPHPLPFLGLHFYSEGKAIIKWK